MPDPNPPGALLPRDRERIVAAWAIWSAGILILASGAMALPTTSSNPWTEFAQAPPLARWDSVWYRSIAVDGYRYDSGSAENSIGFYPLYPLVVRWICSLLGTPVLVTGIALSLLCLLGALLFLADLFAASAGREVVPWALGALLLFPTSFFFAAFYSESLFLLTTAGAFWCARSGRWLGAGLFGLAAALTRFNGFLILLPVVWAVGESAAWRLRAIRLPHAAAIAGPLVGAAGFPIYLWLRWGDPLLYVRSKAVGWNKKASSLWGLFDRVAGDVSARVQEPGVGGKLDLLTGLASTLAFIGLTILLLRRRRIPEGLYAAATLLLLLHSGSLDGMPRFMLALFPCFLVLGELVKSEPVLAFAYAFGATGTGVVLLHRFVHWIIVA